MILSQEVRPAFMAPTEKEGDSVVDLLSLHIAKVLITECSCGLSAEGMLTCVDIVFRGHRSQRHLWMLSCQRDHRRGIPAIERYQDPYLR